MKFKKSKSKKRKQPIPTINNFYPKNNAKMNTIDIAESRIFDEKSQCVFSINDNVGSNLKKSSTMCNLFHEVTLEREIPKPILKKQKVPNSESMKLFDFITDDQRLNTQGSAFSHTSNYISQYLNSAFDLHTYSDEKQTSKTPYESPSKIPPPQRKIKSSLDIQREIERINNNMTDDDHSDYKKNKNLNTVTREYNKEFCANYDQMTNYSEKYKKKSIGNKAQLNTKSVAYMYKQKQRQLKSGNYKFNA